MASLKEIRTSIAAKKNTQQITKAMKLVSAAKLRKAQHSIVNMRPYALALQQVIADIALTQKVSHPLMEPKAQVNKVLLVVLTSDRGLCGAFNTNILKFAEQYYRQNRNVFETIDVLAIGRRANDYFVKRGQKPVRTVTRLDKDISYELAADIAATLLKTYLEGDYDEIRIVYNEFKNALTQKVVCETLLPIDMSKSSFQHDEENEKNPSFSVDLIFEPSAQEIVEQLLIKTFALQVYRTMSESVAGEHGARMTAMENATNNAQTVVRNLSLTYNKLRQDKITRELIEITSGAEALK